MSEKDILKVDMAIRNDTNFLASLNIMDYSLLLGIESKLQINTEDREHTVVNAGRKVSVRTTAELKRFKRHRFTSCDKMQTYHISIIDFLQLWNCNKKSEQFAKTMILRADKKKLSAVEPDFYRQRFQRFMRRQVFIQTLKASRSQSLNLSLCDRLTLHRSNESQVTKTTSMNTPGGEKIHSSAPIQTILEEEQFFDNVFEKFQNSSASVNDR